MSLIIDVCKDRSLLILLQAEDDEPTAADEEDEEGGSADAVNSRARSQAGLLLTGKHGALGTGLESTTSRQYNN